MFKRFLSTVLAIIMVMSVSAGLTTVNASTTYTMPEADTSKILGTIASEYSQALSDAVKDMLFASDYSDFVSDKVTMRSYYSNGNTKAWPHTNADEFATSVVDRGETVDWGWKSAGCMAYAQFFSYSVYDSTGKKDNDKVNLNKNKLDEAAVVLENYAKNVLQPGEHFRNNQTPHSVVFLCNGVENGEKGFYIAEYWGGAQKGENGYAYSEANDQFYVRFYTYTGFAKKYAGTIWYAYNAYETSKYVDEGNQPVVPPVTKTRDVVLVLDISGSMDSDSKLIDTKAAAKKFVDEILVEGQDTRVALVTYGTDVYTNVGLTTDKDALKNAIDGLSTRGLTNIYGGLETASTILEAGGADKKGIVLMTDGAANEGTYTQEGYFTTDEGESVRFSEYDNALIDLTKNYKDEKGYTLYTLGFGLRSGSRQYEMIRHVASFDTTNKRRFWPVEAGKTDDIVFVYEDIADTIVSKEKIIIAIACPVEVSLTSGTETLDKNNTTASFGKVTVTDAEDGNNYMFELDYNTDYDININGTADGTMDFKITYVEGDEEEFREFKNVPITANTVIETSATDKNADFALYVDSDNNGTIDEGWNAGADETATVMSQEVMDEVYPPEPQPVEEEEEVALAVSASIAGGTYAEAQTVTLEASAENAEIYYTTNKKDPVENGTLYTGPITISKTTTLKFVAIDENANQSEVETEKYTIKKNDDTSINTKAEYTVKFETYGGTEIPSQTIYVNETVDKPKKPELEGHTFMGWYRDEDFNNEYDFDFKIKHGFTLYAKWEANETRQIVLTIGEKDAVVFGEKVTNDVAPMIKNDRTMLPIRFVAEALGAKVRWSSSERKVTIAKENIDIEIFIDSDVAYVNGKKVTLDSPAFIEDSRTFLPLRFVSENLGASVEWNGKDRTVTITIASSAASGTKYIVSFDLNYEDAMDAPANQAVEKGETAVKPENPSREEYVFLGWSTDKNSKKFFDFDTEIKKPTKLYAVWADSDPDEDGDGVTVSVETQYGSSDELTDTDKDGLDDYIEIYSTKTNPTLKDSDNDGTPDINEDSDGDKFTNREEISKLGTDPGKVDTDGDSLSDYDEIKVHNTDPCEYDTDGDGVNDGYELELGTDPLAENETFQLSQQMSVEDDTVSVKLDIELDGEQVETLKIEPVENELLFPKDMPGYMGMAYDFTVEGTFESATLSFEFDASMLTEDSKPTICYYNEEEQTLEELETTVVGNVATATVTHFSTYVLVDTMIREKERVWFEDWEQADDTKYTAAEITLVIDDSGSLGSNDRYYQRLEAARNFVDNMSSHAKIGIVLFDSSWYALTNGLVKCDDAGKNTLKSILQPGGNGGRFDNSGGTHMYDGMDLAYDMYSSSDDSDVLRTMIVFTDGESVGTWSGNVKQVALDMNIRIYTVGLGNYNEYVLREIANDTNGKLLTTANADELVEIYEKIGNAIDLSIDSDGDTIPDYYEDNMYAFNGKMIKLNKNSKDTDGDGLMDNQEITFKLTFKDGGKSASVKAFYNSDPLSPDGDGDGVPDSEDDYPLNPKFSKKVTTEKKPKGGK